MELVFKNFAKDEIKFQMFCQDCFLWIEVSKKYVTDFRKFGKKIKDINFKVFLVYKNGRKRNITKNSIVKVSDNLVYQKNSRVKFKSRESLEDVFISASFLHLSTKAIIQVENINKYEIRPKGLDSQIEFKIDEIGILYFF